METIKEIINLRYSNRKYRMDHDLQNAKEIISCIEEISENEKTSLTPESLNEAMMYKCLEIIKKKNKSFIKKDEAKGYVKINHIADMAEILFDIKVDRFKAGYYINKENICSCGCKTEFVDSKIIYHGKSYGMIYFCKNCGGYVGVHPGTNIPLGTCADKETKILRMKAHKAIENKFGDNKNKAYKWLQSTMGLKKENAHIGLFDKEQCQKVIELCR